jgi:succinate dehydrogenase subunit C
MSVALYAWQRASAAVMAPMIAVHIAIIFYASRHAVTAADILARTRGSIGWAAFYAAFVVAASIHGAIGIRNVLSEWSPIGERGAGYAAAIFGAALFALGLRAVAALVLP